MIRSRKELADYLAEENRLYKSYSTKQRFISRFCREQVFTLGKYLYYLRKEEYYVNTAKGNKIKSAYGLMLDRRRNQLGAQLGIEVGLNCFEKGLTIYHAGAIVVNPAARIGENCKLHGANCIGNNGKTQGVPRIGNNVDIGYGAVIIGDIEIADNVVIGANAVVNKSVLTPGSVVVGAPGRAVKACTENEL